MTAFDWLFLSFFVLVIASGPAVFWLLTSERYRNWREHGCFHGTRASFHFIFWHRPSDGIVMEAKVCNVCGKRYEIQPCPYQSLFY